MSTTIAPQPLRRTGKVTAVLVLLIAVVAIFSMIFLPANMVVPGDAATTAENVISAEGAFRISMVGDALIFLLEIAVIVLLYKLFKPVNKTLSMMATFSRLAMAIIQGANVINHFLVLILLSGAGYLAVFETSQLQALAMTALELHAYVVYVWGTVFCLHLLLLGILIYRSGYMPKWIGVVMFVTGLCYVVQSFGNILFPQYTAIFAVIGFASIIELAMPIWLLAKGIQDPA